MKNPFSQKKNKKEEGGSSDSFSARFADNIARFFSTEPQKEKILRHEDFARAGDTYYATVSARFKVAQRIVTLLLVVFLLFSIFTNLRDITYGNFFYFIRDFGNAVDMESTNYETLSYDVYPNQIFRLYRGGIAAVSPSNVSVFTATGRRTLKSRSDFVTPYAVCSGKYVLVYDMVGTSFALYNSFSKVDTKSYDYPISDASISESGVFALLTRSAEYKSVINVYNKRIEKIAAYSKNSYAFDISVDSKGERMAVLFYDVGDGRGGTLLRVYDISVRDKDDKRDADEDRIVFEKGINHAFPLSCSFTESGMLSVITDSSISIFGPDYELYDSVAYSSEISALFAGDSGSAIAVKTGSLNDVNRIIAFDKNGTLIYNGVIRESVNEIELYGKYVFVKSDTGAARLNTESSDTEKYDCQAGKLLVYNENTAIVCAESKAVYIKFTEE